MGSTRRKGTLTPIIRAGIELSILFCTFSYITLYYVTSFYRTLLHSKKNTLKKALSKKTHSQKNTLSRTLKKHTLYTLKILLYSPHTLFTLPPILSTLYLFRSLFPWAHRHLRPLLFADWLGTHWHLRLQAKLSGSRHIVTWGLDLCLSSHNVTWGLDWYGGSSWQTQHHLRSRQDEDEYSKKSWE